MDKSAIKNYAVDARKKLIDAVSMKAKQLYIFDDNDKSLRPDNEVEQLKSDGIFLTSDQLRARGRLYDELLTEDIPYKPDIFHRKMEEIAYTWFNRLIALRFMEINDYLPSGIRILSSKDIGRIEPDALREVDLLPYVDTAKVAALRADTSFNAPEKLYRYILIAQCNALSEILPGMFQRINDYTELLLPDNLYTTGGIVHDLISAITEGNFRIKRDDEDDSSRGQIEIIGWLYQYYTSEKKDEVFAALKKNVKLNKDTIPAATQLFTPEWIVKYMVENSLGRFWLTHCPPSMAHGNADDVLRSIWTYYIEEAEQEDDVEKKLKEIERSYTLKDPTEIKFMDPCMGSGHILVYAFDVLFQIYLSQGYSERDIPNLILQHNIYGLDVDDRAGQLAYFALMMKARGYNRRFFRQENVPQPMVYAIPESRPAVMKAIGSANYLGKSMDEAERTAALDDFKYVVELFGHGKEYGSLIKVDRDVDYDRLKRYLADYPTGQLTFDEAAFGEHAEAFENIFRVSALLGQKYDVVVTNPPYMAPAPKQADWVKKHYPNSKSDLCVVFIERNFDLLKTNGYLSMITMHSWMFLSSYEKFREDLVENKTITNMAHLGARAFEEIGGEVVQTTAFVMQPLRIKGFLAVYERLVGIVGQREKESYFLTGNARTYATQSDFEMIPGMPIAYWASKSVPNLFADNPPLRDIANPRLGFATGDNETFMRMWTEVLISNIGFSFSSREEAQSSKLRWFPTNKGGEFRRWYGNIGLVVNWENDGYEIRNFKDSTGYLRSRPQNLRDCFQQGISWTVISSKGSFRFSPFGFLYNNKGPIINSLNNEWDLYVLGYLNSEISAYLLTILTPTLGFEAGYLASLPMKQVSDKKDEIDTFVDRNVQISKTDWDSFEMSWDFTRHPLLLYGYGSHGLIDGKNIHSAPLLTYDDKHKVFKYKGKEDWKLATGYIDDCFKRWEEHCNEQFSQLKANEEELNRIFIDIYGLQDELTPEVEDKDVTVRKADLGRDIRSFVSYAVGCMFGRYSLDEPGLAFAGGSFDAAKYSTFAPVKDNIIPIGTADYFESDIVLLFVDFVRKVYGESTLGENLDFIANALYPNASGTAQERIRRYFLNDFYKDHVKIYQKRPI